MTTNTMDQLNIHLNLAEKKDDNIRITRSIGSTLEFLDVLIENCHGQLRTSVFHKPAAEPYILPFSSDHPRHVHRGAIKGRLLQAARLTSHVEDFDKERLHIEFILLLNGYPPKFISYHFQKFSRQNNIGSFMDQLDQISYDKLHQRLLVQPTCREKQQQSTDFSRTQRQISKKIEIYVHYTFESGPMLLFKQKLMNLWKQHFLNNNPSMNSIHLKIGTKCNRSMNRLLVNKKPSKDKLINNEA